MSTPAGRLILFGLVAVVGACSADPPLRPDTAAAAAANSSSAFTPLQAAEVAAGAYCYYAEGGDTCIVWADYKQWWFGCRTDQNSGDKELGWAQALCSEYHDGLSGGGELIPNVTTLLSKSPPSRP